MKVATMVPSNLSGY